MINPPDRASPSRRCSLRRTPTSSTGLRSSRGCATTSRCSPYSTPTASAMRSRTRSSSGGTPSPTLGSRKRTETSQMELPGRSDPKVNVLRLVSD
ncbi:hypothetical protein BU23DRAFT_179945 [Bimuria novae-zelandiae CBS 107.79]|uniref:Uncharacterized protein n=1 Tax=Bimuria novae-zelandiae CBS 107.79 TaxID=1447943 RepID=A0A6A5V5P5_9PLEO|nr:hypothetical protein BU23DRAFT_179945 [Bimuria novae-zelandiae CBS 107.79]